MYRIRTLFAITVAFAGAVNVVQAQPSEVNELVKLLADDGAPGDIYGVAVAIDGDTAVIGAIADFAADDAGWAYVCERDADGWRQVAKLWASDREPDDEFGRPVAISGNTIMVGAYHREQSRGAVYVFEKPDDGWRDMSQTCKLMAGDSEPGDQFGSVAISGDTAVIGAHLDEISTWDDGAGSAYVFERNGGCWTQSAKLTASDAASLSAFGAAVAIQNGTILVGAPGGSRPGSAYVFEKLGDHWEDTTETAILTPFDGAPYDEFGLSVALSGDGAVILVGAPTEDNDYGTNAGAAYVFERPDGGSWRPGAVSRKIINDDANAGEHFGYAVALDAAGSLALIGAFRHDECGGGSGAAYVYTRDGLLWHKDAVLTASDCASNDWFGVSVALSRSTAVVGAYGDDNFNGENAGAAYVFDVADEPTRITIDVKPGSHPNSINLGSQGVVPVAILSSSTFDACQVDGETVFLSGAGVAVRGRGNNLLAHEQDVNGDGLLDLVVQVETENLDTSALQEGFAILTGTTLDGVAFVGMDDIIIVP